MRVALMITVESGLMLLAYLGVALLLLIPVVVGVKQGSGMVTFLLWLRLAIGWHFLYEGLQKVRSVYVGETVASRPFSSSNYLREATGPLGGLVRWTLGDPDQEALALLAVKPADDAGEPATSTPHLRTPPGLARDW